MAEEKKKTTKSNNQNKKNQNQKNTTSTKKTKNQYKKNNTTKKTNTTKKAPTKKNTQKKTTQSKIKVDEKQKVLETEVVIIEEKVEQSNEEVLEKTLIFDGRENQNLAEVVEKLEEEHVVLEDKVIKRSKAKKIIIYILTALIFITIISTVAYVVYRETSASYRENSKEDLERVNSNIFDKVSSKYENSEEIDTETKMENDMGQENFENIDTLTLGEFEKKVLEQEDMIVIITSTTCYYSIEYEPIVDEVFKELNKTIYRINITSLTEDETKVLRTYYAFNNTPTIFEIKDGIITKELIGKQDKKNLINWIN